MMKLRRLKMLRSALAGTLLLTVTPAMAVVVEVETPRNAYYRGEVVPVNVRSSDDAGDGAKIRLTLDDRVVREASVAGGQALVRIDTAGLRSAEYTLRVELESSSGKASVEKPLWITKRPNPERMTVWLWPHKAFLDSMKTYDEAALKKLDWWTSIGWNNFAFGEEYQPEMKKFWDYALFKGLGVCVMPNGGLQHVNLQSDDPDVKFKSIDGAVVKEGTIANPFHPAVAKWQDDRNRELMLAARDYPNVSTAFFNTEVLDSLAINGNEAGKRMLQDSGLSPGAASSPKFVAPGVIADDDPKYLLAKYLYKKGNGLSTANARAAAMVHAYRPDVITMNDPYRSFGFLDGFEGVDAIGTWTYVNPDPKLMLYVETLRTVAKDGNKIPQSTVTFLNYPGELAPTDQWMMIDDGRLTVTTWINLSRAPKLLSYYVSSGCDPFGALEDDLKTPKKPDEFLNPTSTYDQLKRLSDTVFKPHGEMIRKLEVSPRRVAVLSSAAASIHEKTPRLLGFYENYQAYQFYTVMAMANIPADILLDESVERFGLDGYDVLVLPKCEAMPKSVYDQVIAFQKRGGVVIADQYLVADIPGAIKFDFDFSYRDKVTAMAIHKNENFVGKDDHLQPNEAKKVQVTGVTALDDQKILETYAAKLREGLKSVVKREVDCLEPTALLNLTEADGVKYLFVINDKREYGPRLGEYKAVLEKIVPQTVNVSLPSASVHAYDLIAGKELAVKTSESGASIDVALDQLGGTIVALYPEAIGSVKASAPERMKAGQTQVLAVDMVSSSQAPMPGLQPLRVTLVDPDGRTNEYSDYYCAERGALRIDFTPAVNEPAGRWTFRVDDLTTGQTAETSFDVIP